MIHTVSGYVRCFSIYEVVHEGMLARVYLPNLVQRRSEFRICAYFELMIANANTFSVIDSFEEHSRKYDRSFGKSARIIRLG